MKSSARGRTMAHMHHMLAATAAVGCTRGDGTQTVTIAPAPTVPASIDTTSPAPLPPVASATFTAPPPTPPPPDPSGYLVVDMLPAPARCLGLSNSASSSSRFVAGSSGLELEVVVQLPSKGNLKGSTFLGSASVWPGQVTASSFAHGNTIATVRVKVPPQSTSASVTLGVSCGSAGQGSLLVTATFAATPHAGSSASLSLSDY